MLKRLMNNSALLYLGFCFFNVLFYSSIKYFHNTSLPEYSTLEIACYENLFTFGLIFCFTLIHQSIYKDKKRIITFENFKRNSRLSFAAIASATKMFSLQFISANSIFVVSFLTPFATALLCILYLKERVKLKTFSYLLISFIGILVFVSADLKGNTIIYMLLLLYVLLKSHLNIFVKQLSESRMSVLFYENCILLHVCYWNINTL